MNTTCSVPCPTCPWRKTSTVGGADIRGFDLALMEGLANTVGDGDDFRPIMACHHSKPDEEFACAGYLAVEGWSNLSVRIAAMNGRIDMRAVESATAELDLWSDFHTMLNAYRDAECVERRASPPVDQRQP